MKKRRDNSLKFQDRYVLGTGYPEFDTDMYSFGIMVGVTNRYGTRECKKLKQPKALTTYYEIPKYRIVLEKVKK